LRLTGVYFDLTDRFAPTPGARPRLPEGGPAEKKPGIAGSRILISVAKRLVPSAVRRNTVKRIVREAWRAAVLNAASMELPTEQSLAQETNRGSARQSSHGMQGKERSGRQAQGETTSRACLVRLKRFPGSDPKAGTRNRTNAAGTTGTTGTSGARKPAASKAGATPPMKSGIAATRRLLRADVDGLFAAFLAERALPERIHLPGISHPPGIPRKPSPWDAGA